MPPGDVEMEEKPESVEEVGNPRNWSHIPAMRKFIKPTGVEWLPCVAWKGSEQDGQELQGRENLHGPDCLCLGCNRAKVSFPDGEWSGSESRE